MWRSVTASLDSVPGFVYMPLLSDMVAHIVSKTPGGCIDIFECPFEEQRANGACMSAQAKNRAGNTI